MMHGIFLFPILIRWLIYIVVASLVRARQQKVRDPSLSLSRRHLVLVGVSEGEATQKSTGQQQQ
jgi:hypothetical protein